MGKTSSQGLVGRLGVLAVLLPLAFSAPAAAAPPPVGGLTQLPGTAACVSFDGSGGACGTGRAVDGAESSSLSPDGHTLYVGSYKSAGNEAGFSVFSRSGSTGALSQLPGTQGCLTADGKSPAGPGTCTAVRGLSSVGDGRDLAISSDGRWAYIVGQGAGGTSKPTIMLFNRDPSTGALTQLPGTQGCISSDGSAEGVSATCQTDSTLKRPDAITISPDDQYVYVSDYGTPNGLRVYSRDPATGALTRVQCLEVAPAAAGCTTVRDAGYANAFVISSDGTHAYSANLSANGISIFDRDPSTGLLTQKAGKAGCVNDTGASTCEVANGLGGAYGLALSPNGQTLYVSSTGDAGIAIFHVAADGTLSQLSGTDGCITLDGKSGGVAGRCGVGRGLALPYLPTVSPNGKTLYVPSKAPTAGGVAIFSLDQATGKATQLPGQSGCITADGSSAGMPGQCTTGTAVAGGSSIAVDPTSGFAYLAAYNAHAVAAFVAQGVPSCAPVIVATPYGQPVTIPLSCADMDGDTVTRSIASAPTFGSLGPVDQASGTVTYTPGTGFSRNDRFGFTASDGTNVSGEATITIRAAEPKLSHVHQSKGTWRRGKGTTFKFTLNEAATVTLTFELPQPGRRVKRVCEPPSTSNAGHPSCTLNRPAGRLMITAHAGVNRVRFHGRLRNGRRLRPGSYKMWIVADNAAGSSRAKRLQFVILS